MNTMAKQYHWDTRQQAAKHFAHGYRGLMILLFSLLLNLILSQAHALPYHMNKPTQVAFNRQEQQAYQLQVAKQLLNKNQLQQAKQVLQQVKSRRLSPTLRIEKYLLDAHLAITLGYPKQALNQLGKIIKLDSMKQTQEISYYQLAGMAYQAIGQFYHAALAHIQLTEKLANRTIKQNYINQTWEDIQQLTPEQLENYRSRAKTAVVKGWLLLGLLVENYRTEKSSLNQVLHEWQQRYPQHPANQLLPDLGYIDESNVPPVNHIALLVPLTGPLAKSGNAIKKGFMTAFYDRHRNSTPEQTLNFFDTYQQNIDTLYERAANAGATVIVGPLTKNNVNTLAQSHDLDVPTLALNYTPYSTDNLYQYALSPKNEAQLVAQKALAEHRLRAVIVAPDSFWAQGIVQTFTQMYQQQGGHIIANETYGKSTNLSHLVRNLLHIPASEQRTKRLKRLFKQRIYTLPRRRQDIDLIFLVATPTQARRIRPLFKFYFASDIPIYATSVVYSGQKQPLKDQDLNGIQFCAMPWVISDSPQIKTAKQQMQQLLTQPSASTIRLFAFGYDAYQLATALPRIAQHPNSRSLQGVTGILYLSYQQRFYRQLTWAKFQNGLAKIIKD